MEDPSSFCFSLDVTQPFLIALCFVDVHEQLVKRLNMMQTRYCPQEMLLLSGDWNMLTI